MRTPAELAAGAAYPISPLELAAGVLTGLDPEVPAVQARFGTDVAAATRSVIERAVAGRQAYVTFSGGRDSSAVLALTTAITRRIGAADPVPLTLRVVGSAAADETEWQELVMRHLALPDWIRIEITDELDIFGPLAHRSFERYGLLCPANAYFEEITAGYAAGGILLTGAGGDELFEGSYAHPHVRARLRQERLRARTAAAIALSVAAKPLYDIVQARQVPRLPWLRPRAQRRFARRLVAPDLAPVRGWSADLASLVRLRATAAANHAQELVAAAHATTIVNPFVDPAVIGAAMAQGGRTGLGGRSAAMHDLIGTLLPDAVAQRHTKANFQDALWSDRSRDMLRSGTLLDVVAADEQLRPYLDLDGLRRTWQARYPHFASALLAQAAQFSLVT